MKKYQNRELQKIVVSLLGSSLLGYRAFFIIAGVLLFFAWLPDGMSSLLDKIFGGEIFGLAILKIPKLRAFNSPHRDLSDRNLKF